MGVELADIFNCHGAQYREKFGDRMPVRHRQAMRAIEQCRTEFLGGHVYHSHLNSTFNHQEEEYGTHHPDECSYESHLVLNSIDLINVGIINILDYSSTLSVLHVLSLENFTIESHAFTACGYYLKFPINTPIEVFASNISPPLLI